MPRARGARTGNGGEPVRRAPGIPGWSATAPTAASPQGQIPSERTLSITKAPYSNRPPAHTVLREKTTPRRGQLFFRASLRPSEFLRAASPSPGRWRLLEPAFVARNRPAELRQRKTPGRTKLPNVWLARHHSSFEPTS